MKCGKNRLRIKKMLLNNNGELESPGVEESYTIRVESCFTRQYFVLNKWNCFCVELNHLMDDTICVYEDDGKEVIYRVDGVDYEEGCVDFSMSHFCEMIVINKEESPTFRGSLRIRKEIRQECGEPSPTSESFAFEIRGEQYQKDFILGPSNHYTIQLDDLVYGNYVVRELNHEYYDVSYEVNGVESSSGDIVIEAPYGEMMIYNQRNDVPHFVNISKWIQEGNRLEKPTYPNAYEIRVNDGFAVREYVLNCQNRFVQKIRGYNQERFTIEEVGGNQVYYEVDGEIVENVDILMNQDHDVRIINVKTKDKGSIILQKWMMEEGRLVVPPASLSFVFTVVGYREEPYVLNASNDFTIVIEEVEEGEYQIVENKEDVYDVYYEVNGKQQEDGRITVLRNEATSVSAVNYKTAGREGVVSIRKRIVNEYGEILPQKEAMVVIEGVKRSYYCSLTNDNNFENQITLDNGWYRLYEENAEDVTYRLDGVDHKKQVDFYIHNSSHDILILSIKNKVNYII